METFGVSELNSRFALMIAEQCLIPAQIFHADGVTSNVYSREYVFLEEEKGEKWKKGEVKEGLKKRERYIDQRKI